jgi:hypothetical protein
MNKLFFLISFISVALFTSCKEKSTTHIDTSYISTFEAKPGMEVLQFHMEHRCKTCVAIEEVTKKTILPYENLPFKLINIEEPENDSLARSFQVAGTALFLYDPATGNKKDLTDFAFLTAFEEEKFIKGLQKEIDQF